MTALRTLTTSYSFYVRERRPDLLAAAAGFGDAITVAGPKGPDMYRRAPAAVRMKPVIFDGEGYRGYEYDPEVWARTQRSVGADRVLLPGVSVDWDKSDSSVLTSLLTEQGRMAHDLDATVVLAVDSRWIAKRVKELIDQLARLERPVALIPMHRDDPFGSSEAVDGLRMLCRAVPMISLLRTDHAAIGALASGAVHASMGLATGTRHYAAPASSPQKFGDQSSRLFLRELIDWYRASEVAGWIAGGVPVSCALPCCAGQRFDRFLDPSVDATLHNLHSLQALAEFILGADPTDWASLWLETCRSAVQRYGTGWFRGPTDPKRQLRSWAFS